MHKRKEGNNQKRKPEEKNGKFKKKTKLPPVRAYQVVREQAEGSCSIEGSESEGSNE